MCGPGMVHDAYRQELEENLPDQKKCGIGRFLCPREGEQLGGKLHPMVIVGIVSAS